VLEVKAFCAVFDNIPAACVDGSGIRFDAVISMNDDGCERFMLALRTSKISA